MAGIAWSKRLAKLIAVALLVAVTCVAFGIWQIARLHQKQQFNAAVARVWPSRLRPLDAAALPTASTRTRVRYRRVEATGTYDMEHEFVLYGRTQDSQAGNHLLTPLRLSDGRRDPRGSRMGALERRRARRSRRPLRPSGDVDVEGVLFSSEGDPPGAEEPADPHGATTLPSVDLTAIQSQLPYPIAPDLPAAAGADPRRNPKGSRSPLPCPSCPKVRT